MISVIIPVYNGEIYLSQALDSLSSDLEILLIDDGSTDQTRSVAENHPMRCFYYYQPHRGVAAARNFGIEKARGEYIAFLDADDVYLPHKLPSQLKFLQENPHMDAILCPIQLTDENLRYFEDPFISFSLGSALIRKELFQRVGLCDPSLLHGEDTDWFLRARDQGAKIAFQNEAGMLYRQHSGNMTRDVPLNRQYLHHVLFRSIQRRRILALSNNF